MHLTAAAGFTDLQGGKEEMLGDTPALGSPLHHGLPSVFIQSGAAHRRDPGCPSM